MSVHRRKPRRSREPSTAPTLVISTLVLVVSTLATLPSAAQQRELASRDVGSAAERIPERLYEKTVRTAYRTLEEYTAHAGAGIRFEIENVRTVPREDFDSVRVIDVATMPEGRVIDVEQGGRTSDYPNGLRTRQVFYRASWRDQEPQWRSSPQTVAGMESSLEEVLPLLAEQNDVRFARTEALTLYHVTATLGEESRTYHAGFFWFREPGGGAGDGTDFMVVDHITQGVERALREEIPVEGKVLREGVPPEAGEDGEPTSGRGDGPTLATRAGCLAGINDSRYTTFYGQGSNSHITGYHSGSAGAALNCYCDSTCAQTCQGSVSGMLCDDYGFPSSSCHKMAFAEDGGYGVSFSGGGASCAAGFKCTQTACLFCLCNLSVSVDAMGFNVSFGGTDGEWSMKRQATAMCRACSFDTGGGGGGGGGGPGCGAGVTNTNTASMSLVPEPVDATAEVAVAMRRTQYLDSLHGGPAVDFPLHRVETRQGENFVMEEWAIVEDGLVIAASDPAFGRAVLDQEGAGATDRRLVIQKPVHERNDRWVPEPGIFSQTDGNLPAPLRDKNALVTARLEFAPNGHVDSVDFLESSVPIDERLAANTLKHSIELLYGNDDKTHRAAAYVLVLLQDGVHLLRATSVLPQCCCGTDEPFCI